MNKLNVLLHRGGTEKAHNERLTEKKVQVVREERLRRNGKGRSWRHRQRQFMNLARDKAGDIGRDSLSHNLVLNFILKVV